VHVPCRQNLELSGTFAKVTAWRNFEPWHGVRIISVGANGIPPPHELDALVAESKEDDHGRESSAGLHGGLEKI